MGLRPQNEALAFRVWQTARTRGWDITVKELAQELGVSWRRIAVVVREKKWVNRLRADGHGPHRGQLMDVPLYDAVWHKTFAVEAREAAHVLRRFGA